MQAGPPQVPDLQGEWVVFLCCDVCVCRQWGGGCVALGDDVKADDGSSNTPRHPYTQVVPVSTSLGLIEWLPDTRTLKSIIEKGLNEAGVVRVRLPA